MTVPHGSYEMAEGNGYLHTTRVDTDKWTFFDWKTRCIDLISEYKLTHMVKWDSHLPAQPVKEKVIKINAQTQTFISITTLGEDFLGEWDRGGINWERIWSGLFGYNVVKRFVTIWCISHDSGYYPNYLGVLQILLQCWTQLSLI